MSDRGFRFWLARLLAPVAFFAAATLLVLLVRESFGDESNDSPATLVITNDAGETVRVTTTFEADETTDEEPADSEPADEAPTAADDDAEEPGQRFYRVRDGDTFESIAEQFGLSVAELQRLNPRIDAVAIQVGQRIRLRE